MTGSEKPEKDRGEDLPSSPFVLDAAPSLFDAKEWQSLAAAGQPFQDMKEAHSVTGAAKALLTSLDETSTELPFWEDDPKRWLHDPLEAFRLWMLSPLANHGKGFSQDSLKVYSSMWGKFVRYAIKTGSNPCLSNEDEIFGFLQTLQQERSELVSSHVGSQMVRSRDSHGVGRHSRRYLALLSKVQSHLVQMGVRRHNVAEHLFTHTEPEPPRADPIPLKPQNDRGLRNILAQVNSQDWKSVRDMAIVNLVAGSGLTSLQLRSLKDHSEQVNMFVDPAWVRPVPARRGHPRPQAIPLSKDAADALAAWLKLRRKNIPGDWLFPSTLDGLQMSSSSVYRAVAQAMALATPQSGSPLAPHMGPRTLRHTFATRQLQAGLDMTVVQQWLGHRDIRSTAVYQKFVRSRTQPT